MASLHLEATRSALAPGAWLRRVRKTLLQNPVENDIGFVSGHGFSRAIEERPKRALQAAEKLMLCIRARLLVVPYMIENRSGFSP